MLMEKGQKYLETGHELEPELSCLILISEIRGDFFKKEIKATHEQCLKLAKRFDLIEVKSLKACLKFSFSSSQSRVHVEGNFVANVIQQCVVTLKPVPRDVQGIFSCKYSETPTIEDTETIDFDLMTEDPPEPIVDGQFDAGIILTEQLGLELDPFPRSPEARFDNLRYINSANRPDRYSSNPFAILKKLK